VAQHKQARRTGIKVSSALGFVVVLALVTGYFNRQYIWDQITVSQYQPAKGAVELTTRAGVGEYGKFLYLASRPVLESTQNFNSVCSRTEVITSILGCYADGRIYLYDVSDPQLDGVREVTATHEMLHAAYVRLSSDEQSKLDDMLEAEYSKLKSDKGLQEKMAFYERTEPGQRDNELHSVIGTEVANISPALEKYYDKYFDHRDYAVKLNAQYITVFKNIEFKADNLKKQLDSISADVESKSKKYNIDVGVIDADIRSFNLRASSGDFSSQDQFNYERYLLVRRTNELGSDKIYINNQIDLYNKLVLDYNALATQSQKLYNSLDSTLAPAPSI